MQAGIRGNLREKIDRLADHADQCRKLARLELLQRGRVVEQHLLDLHAEALEHDGTGETRRASSGAEAYLLAAEVLDAFDVGSGENVELRDGQAHDVIDPQRSRLAILRCVRKYSNTSACVTATST